MIDRDLVRDVSLAVLLGLPTAALARPESPPPKTSAAAPLVQQAAASDSTQPERRFSIDS